ncbi:MAG: hypothetical protein JXQ89_18350 [Pelagimonas sp.]
MTKSKRVRPKPGDPDFEEVLKTSFAGYDEVTRSDLVRRLKELPSDLDATEEIQELERHAALTIYAQQHFSDKPLTENQRKNLIRKAKAAAKKLEEAIADLSYNRIFPSKKNSEYSNPGMGEFKFELQDLLAALREFPISLDAAHYLPIHEMAVFTDIGDFSSQNRNAHKIEFIEACMQIWIRNGGTFGMSVKEIEDESKDDNTYRTIEGGIIGFTYAAHLSVFQKAGLEPYTHDALRKHWQDYQKDLYKRWSARML